MRNIYNIITEQKVLVDINIEQYELTYILEQFANDDSSFYIEESIGESVKNAIDKVIAFVKSILSKIGELIAKVIRFLTGNKDRVAKMNQKIADANNGKFEDSGSGGGGGGGESVDQTTDRLHKESEKSRKETEEIKERQRKEKAAREREEELERNRREKERMRKEQETEKSKRKEYKKATNVHFVVENSNLRVRVTYFPPLEKKIELSNKFFDVFEKARREFADKRIDDYDIFVGTVVDRTFRGRGGNDALSANRDRGDSFNSDLEKRIRLEVNESGKDEYEYYISTLAKNILSYLDGGEGAVKYLQAKDRAVRNELNKILKYLEGIKNDRTGMTSEDGGVQSKYLMVKEAANLVGTFTNIMVKLVVSSNQKALQLAEQATNAYVAEVKAKYKNK